MVSEVREITKYPRHYANLCENKIKIVCPFTTVLCLTNFPSSQGQKKYPFWIFCLAVRPMFGIENIIFIASGVKKWGTYILFLVKQFIFLGEFWSLIPSKILTY